MPADARRFVIVPRDVLTDDVYAAVRADREALGAWLLLFLEADALWPASPSLPRWVSDAHVELLASSGLLTLEAGDRYRLAIVDGSRMAAKDKATRAANARWNDLNDARSNARSNAPSNAWTDAQPMPTQTQTETETGKRGGSVTPRARAMDGLVDPLVRTG